MRIDRAKSASASASAPPARGRAGWGQALLVGVVLLYAATLLLGPLVALVAGAFGEGPATLLRELRRPDAVHALKLTLLLALGATLFNALFGVCVALVIVRQDFRGRGVLNALVDLPFAVSPVIAGFAILVLFGRQG